MESKIILTEGALVERLKAEFGAKMDNFINHAGLIYTKPEILEMLYRQYINIAKKHQLPVMIMTPTRRVNFESLRESSFRDKNIIADTCLFLNSIKESYKEFSQNILIGGLMGCKGDAYSGKKVLSTEDSYIFHKQQAIQFQNNNTDYLFAGIMPEINETIGMAKAMAETKIPFIISFMIRKNGCLMDGTPLSKAIQLIDEQVYPNPVCYMANCIHPTNLLEALSNPKNKESAQLKRFCGIQANASILSPEELNNCEILHQNDFKVMVDEMYHLKQQFGLKIFGGCCGTNDEFLEILTKTMLVRGN
ncbi:MAG: homocysteine S-methyltransferase family protein [Bacteroidales bacterium]|nr:homocysteine S-methyltransferase family protein [Bacteroidales bacterium]